MVREQRRLAAILAADVVGYSRLMGRDESGTLARLREHREQRLEPTLARYGGRLVKLIGDGALAEFPSAVDAVSAAIEFQQSMAEANAGLPPDTALVFRIGLHLGDLIVDGDDLYGDGVNIAARLEAEATAGGILISGNVHDAVVGRLKSVFEDMGDLALKNIERPVRAYRVRVEEVAPASPAAAPLPTADAPLPLPDKPSIAVLPFQNMSGDPEQEYFADGMVEDIITALSRTKALFIIARNSTFSYKGKSPDIRKVGRELGVRYVLEGSVRKAGNRLRITGQLIDAQSGAHIWADRFDGELSDVFALQDEVAARVVVAIVPTLEHAEIRRTSNLPTKSLAAYDCSLRGWACIDQHSREANAKALEYFERAIELDPGFALAWAQAASCYNQRKSWRWSDDADRDRRETERLSRRALELDQSDPRVLMMTGFALGFVLGLNDESHSLLERATELDPNYFLAWLQLGFACIRLGKPSVPHFQRALRLNPRDVRAPFAQYGLALAHLLEGDNIKAIELAEQGLRQLPTFPPALLILGAALAYAGRIEEARTKIAFLLEKAPSARISNSLGTIEHPPYRQALTKGYRLAGLPD